MSSASPTLVAERYRLLEPLGSGGMGRVWHAWDEILGRDVAIKEIVPPEGLTAEEREEVRRRTLREARAAARLNHPNVVRVYDVFEAGDRPWIVMEYVPSRSLSEIVASDGPLEPIRAAQIGLGVLAALRAAHRAGVLHRDVKPSNVLLADDGRVVLTDFGIATLEGDANVTRPGLVLGSPAYIAPERARDGVGGPASDLWSLGATLYAAVEGRSPYERTSAIATLTALASEEPDPPRRAGLLRPVLTGLLRKDPSVRINAAETERRLRRAAAGGRLADRLRLPRPRSVPRPERVHPPGSGGGPGPSGPVFPGSVSPGAEPVTPAAALPPAVDLAGVQPPGAGPPGFAVSAASEVSPGAVTPRAVGRSEVPRHATPTPLSVGEAVGTAAAAATDAVEVEEAVQAREARNGDEPHEDEVRTGPSASADDASVAAPAAAAVAAAADFDDTAPAQPTDVDGSEASARTGTETAVAVEPTKVAPSVAAEAAAGGRTGTEETVAAGPVAAGSGPARTDETVAAGPAATATGATPADETVAAGPTRSAQTVEAPPAADDEPVGSAAAPAESARREAIDATVAGAGAALPPAAVAHGRAVGSTAISRSGQPARLGGEVTATRIDDDRPSRVRGTAKVPTAPPAPEPSAVRRRGLLVAAILVLVALITAGALLAARTGGDGAGGTATGPTVSAPASPAGSPSPAAPSPSPTDAATTGPTQDGARAAPPETANRGQPPLPIGWRVYRDPTGFSLYVPNGWSQSREGSIVYFRDPFGGRVLGIDQTNQPKPDPLVDWQTQAAYRVARGDFPGYQQIKIVRVNYWLNAADWEFTYNGRGGRVHVLNRGFIVSPNKAHGIWWQTPDSTWAANRPMIDLIFQSFRPAGA
jgi:hypothetical protein